MRRTAKIKAGVLALLALTAVVLTLVFGTPDISAMRSRVDAAGWWGPALFFAFYVGMALIPAPMSVLTVTGGSLFGLWSGAGLSLAGALVGAVISFVIGRQLGREAVDRLLRGRLERVDALLADHGLSAVLTVRLLPILPFVAINYGSALSGVRLRHYVLGSAIGMIPGCLAYTALGAYGTNPWGLAAAVSALIVLVVGGSWWARRLDARHRSTPAAERSRA
ncbi:TVP38/TMEM64 family protein [Janibacter sp. GS2]|uniref:TVP38/TMEM64 family protein n=1 Tax=Janibacter sp. GS2 TaxID=3442646 RepID=UPI003EBD0F0B